MAHLPRTLRTRDGTILNVAEDITPLIHRYEALMESLTELRKVSRCLVSFVLDLSTALFPLTAVTMHRPRVNSASLLSAFSTSTLTVEYVFPTSHPFALSTRRVLHPSLPTPSLSPSSISLVHPLFFPHRVVNATDISRAITNAVVLLLQTTSGLFEISC